MLLHTFRVPRKRKVKKFRAVTAVKEMARERIGAVPPMRREAENKKKRALESPKHRPTTKDLLEE